MRRSTLTFVILLIGVIIAMLLESPRLSALALIPIPLLVFATVPNEIKLIHVGREHTAILKILCRNNTGSKSFRDQARRLLPEIGAFQNWRFVSTMAFATHG